MDVSSPAPPLVSGPRPLVTNCQLGSPVKWLSQGLGCSGNQMESEVRGRFRLSPGGLPAHPAVGQRLGWEAPGTDALQGSRVLPKTTQELWPRPWGSGEPLPHPCLWDRIAVALHLGRDLWDLAPPLRPPEAAEGQLSRAPGSLRDDSWTGCGNLALREPPAELCSSQAGLGPRRVSAAPWDLPFCQDRE